MSQQSLFNLIAKGGHFFAAKGFVSNGFVAKRVNDWHCDHEGLALMVHRYADQDRNQHWLVPAHVLAELPPINEFPRSLVFASNEAKPPYDLDQLFFVNADPYELIVGGPYLDSEEGPFVTYRCYRAEASNGSPIPIVTFYDVDGDLIGFVAGLWIEERRQEIQAALDAALASKPGETSQ
ncbi:MAG: hypothetical protein BroJett011_04310 [Chloroflexota bacterium]|nr:MAG: hypothetical protein BroJett011_04310 [Chloroflexota bacterium]